MEKILSLSQCELNFTTSPPSELLPFFEFNFQEKIPQVMSLLSLDHNLARLHAKISPKMDEEVFWKNYYARIFFLRYRSGIDNPQPLPSMDAMRDEDVIFYPSTSGSSPGKVAMAVSTSSVSPLQSSQLATVASAQLSTKNSSSSTSSSPSPSNSKTSPSQIANSTVVVQRGSPEQTSSDWDTCDDYKESGKSSKPSVVAAGAGKGGEVKSSQSKRLSEEIENMKKVENERMKKREAEAAALAAEVRSPLPKF